MKIVFFDSLLPKGHKMINENYISNMKKNGYDVIVADSKKHEYGNVQFLEADWCSPQSGSAGLTRLESIKNFLKLIPILGKIEFDFLYIASYDICVFWLVFPFLVKYKSRIILQEHNNIDHLSNKIMYFMYSCYKNKINHFVFESYFADRLIELGVRNDLLHVIPHCYGNEKGLINNNKLIVSLSNSNDPELVRKIITSEKEGHYFSGSGTNLVIKSNDGIQGEGAITVLTGWLSEEKLDSYYDRATYVLLLFPSSYAYRVSAVFMEAISRNKYVISSDFLLARYYKEKYPGICSVFNLEKEISQLMDFDIQTYRNDRKRFLEDHSNDLIMKSFDEFFIGAHRM